MKIGSEEWFVLLNDSISFPARCIYFYNKKLNTIAVRRLESKAKIENARWQDVKPTALAFQIEKDNAVIQVKEIVSDKQYYEELLTLQKEWETIPF